MAQVTVSSNLLNKLRGKNIIATVNQEVTDFSSEVLARLKTDYVKDKNGMWVIADRNSKRSIDKWRKYRDNAKKSDRIAFIFRNDARNDKGVNYSKFIKGEPFVSKEKGLTENFFDERFANIEEQFKNRIKNALKGSKNDIRN
jgi:hypothetical protein